MANLVLQLLGAVLEICGFIALYFLVALYVSIKTLGGSIERKHAATVSGVALLLILGGMVLYYLGGFL